MRSSSGNLSSGISVFAVVVVLLNPGPVTLIERVGQPLLLRGAELIWEHQTATPHQHRVRIGMERSLS